MTAIEKRKLRKAAIDKHNLKKAIKHGFVYNETDTKAVRKAIAFLCSKGIRSRLDHDPSCNCGRCGL